MHNIWRGRTHTYMHTLFQNLVISLHSKACERSWAERISAPCSRGCSLPPLYRSKSHQTAPLNSAHLKFHPAPVKSFHARSNLKCLCMPNTCHFQPKPYAWNTLPAWRGWFVAWLLFFIWPESCTYMTCRFAFGNISPNSISPSHRTIF